MKNIKEELSLSGKEKLSDFPKKFNRLVVIVERLVNGVSFLFALAITVLVEILFFDEISQVSNTFGVKWSEIPEGYQLLILGIPAAIISQILAYIIIKKYIAPLIKK